MKLPKLIELEGDFLFNTQSGVLSDLAFDHHAINNDILLALPVSAWLLQ